MRGIIDLHELVDVYVGVPLRGGKVLVSEHFLDGPEVGSRVEQVGGEGMPESVRTQLLPKPARNEFRLEDAVHGTYRQSPSAGIPEDGR